MANNYVQPKTISLTMTGSAVQFSSTAKTVNRFALNAPSTNTGTISVGTSTVTAADCMWQLDPGDDISVDLIPDKMDIQYLYAIGTASDTISLGHLDR